MNSTAHLKEQADGRSWYGKRVTHLCYHMSVAWMYFAAIYGHYDLPCRLTTIESPSNYAGFWKYLTYWNILVQFLFFSFSCITDSVKPSNHHFATYDKMLKFRDTVFAGIVFPYGVFITIMFWGAYANDREQIFPSKLDGFFPPWLNHVSHTVQVPTLCLEAFIVNHRYPSRKEGFAANMGFGSVYLIWIFYLALAKDIWVYEILKGMAWYGRLIFIPFCLVLMLVIYIGCEKINDCFWGPCSSSVKIKSFYRKKM